MVKERKIQQMLGKICNSRISSADLPEVELGLPNLAPPLVQKLSWVAQPKSVRLKEESVDWKIETPAEPMENPQSVCSSFLSPVEIEKPSDTYNIIQQRIVSASFCRNMWTVTKSRQLTQVSSKYPYSGEGQLILIIAIWDTARTRAC